MRVRQLPHLRRNSTAAALWRHSESRSFVFIDILALFRRIIIARGLAQTPTVWGLRCPEGAGSASPAAHAECAFGASQTFKGNVCASPGVLYRVLCFHRHSRIVRRFFDVRDPISSQGLKVPQPYSSASLGARASSPLLGRSLRAGCPRSQRMQKLQAISLTSRAAALSRVMQGRVAPPVWPVGISLEPSSTKLTPLAVPPP